MGSKSQYSIPAFRLEVKSDKKSSRVAFEANKTTKAGTTMNSEHQFT